MKKKNKSYTWIILIMEIVLLVLLSGFVAIGGGVFGSAANIMSQVGVQRTRIERFTKDVLLLSNHPTSLVRAQAVGELQDSLPLWQKTQHGLQIGDSSLGLPAPQDAEITAMLSQAQNDFVPLSGALQQISNHPTPLDELQVQIVLSHENAYLLSMNQVNRLWQVHIESAFGQIGWIEIILIVAITAITLLNFRLLYPKNSATS